MPCEWSQLMRKLDDRTAPESNIPRERIGGDETHGETKPDLIIRCDDLTVDLTGLFWTKGFDRNRLGKEPCHAEEEV